MLNEQVQSYLAGNHERFEEDLCAFLRIPSVSAVSERRSDVIGAADWLARHLQQIGLAAEVWPTLGNPVVFAQTPPLVGVPTVLVYGHYDVQPPDPLELWESPPFEPTRRDGNLYARGATDDKGQLLTHVKSVQAWLAATGRTPVNVKFLIEGEEEVGSPSLEACIQAHRERLACDVVVVSDTSQFAPGQPAITYGLRGIAYYELRLQGPCRDLHSGTFGGAVLNPANALARLLADLVDDQGRIQLPGFYDDVVPLTADERGQWAALGFSDEQFAAQLGLQSLAGEAGYTTLERRWGRPTYDVHGLTSGYQGEGAKTVLPAKASAKFSFRLVPKQDPVKIRSSLETWLARRCPPGVTWELLGQHGAPGIVVSLDSPYMQAARRAIAEGFGRPPVMIREGGSIPVVATFRELLGVDTLLLGWGLDDDNTHSPNEKFCLADFHRGIGASACLWGEIAALPRR